MVGVVTDPSHHPRGGGFGDADANNDSRISRDEAMAAPPLSVTKMRLPSMR